jgi:hypothetical protein
MKEIFGMNIVVFIGALLILIVLLAIASHPGCKNEGYRDPIYINRYKLYNDYYPRANGSIYGPYSNIFSGYAYYPSAY